MLYKSIKYTEGRGTREGASSLVVKKFESFKSYLTL